MQKLVTITLITILSTGLIVACGSDDTNEENNEEQTNESNELINNDEQENEVNENVKEEDTVNETTDNENDGNTSDNNGVSGDYDDQTDLRLGDSGKMSTTIGEYEVTFSNAEILTEIEGEETQSQFDFFVTVDISVTNLGESEIEAEDIRSNFEIRVSEYGSGYPNISQHLDGVETFEGTIESSATLDGQMVFEVIDVEEYYIDVKGGLLASSAVSNNLLWTFDKSEAE